jgi:hypothetical protein
MKKIFLFKLLNKNVILLNWKVMKTYKILKDLISIIIIHKIKIIRFSREIIQIYKNTSK